MNISEWLIGISVLATLALAVAAFLSIRENRRIRAEERQSDFKRRAMEDIINWVIDINKLCIPPNGVGEEAYKEWCRNITSSIASEGKWAIRNAQIFGSEFKARVDGLLEVIVSMNDKIHEIGEFGGIFSDEQARELLSKEFISVIGTTDIVLDAALKIKSDEKL